MVRPLRIEFEGATYHVTSRGNRQGPIYTDDTDRLRFLQLAAAALQRGQASLLAYCLMGNHYHLVLQTARANLSLLMRQINGHYTQAYNRRHHTVGHLFQGRFKAIVVDREAYLLELCRYVELNPVRAGLLQNPADWPWSSLRAHLGLVDAPVWLDTAQVHGLMLGRPATRARDVQSAQTRYRQLLASAKGVKLWDFALRQQIYLGGEAFVERTQALALPARAASIDIPSVQRAEPRPLERWMQMDCDRSEAFARAHREGGHTMTAIAHQAGLTVGRVSQLIAAWEKTKD